MTRPPPKPLPPSARTPTKAQADLLRRIRAFGPQPEWSANIAMLNRMLEAGWVRRIDSKYAGLSDIDWTDAGRVALEQMENRA